MWRLLPLLAVLGFLEVLVPWPDVAALVLSDTTHTGANAVSPRPMSPIPVPGTVSTLPSDRHSVDKVPDPSGLLGQARVISP